MCAWHGRWLLNANADQALEFLDLRGLPEAVAAQRQWAGVVRRAVRAGMGPGEVFSVAYAVVCRWWDLALEWEGKRVWPARLHVLAGGDASGDFWRWRAVARDAAIFPEVVEVTRALLDPEQQWYGERLGPRAEGRGRRGRGTRRTARWRRGPGQ